MFAQKSVTATPKSVVFNLNDQTVVNATEKSLPELNLNAIIAEDIIDEQNGLPPRFIIQIYDSQGNLSIKNLMVNH